MAQRLTYREGAYFGVISFAGEPLHVEFEMDEGRYVDLKRLNNGPVFPWPKDELEEIAELCEAALFADAYDYWYPLWLGERQAGLVGNRD